MTISAHENAAALFAAAFIQGGHLHDLGEAAKHYYDALDKLAVEQELRRGRGEAKILAERLHMLNKKEE